MKVAERIGRQFTSFPDIFVNSSLDNFFDSRKALSSRGLLARASSACRLAI